MTNPYEAAVAEFEEQIRKFGKNLTMLVVIKEDGPIDEPENVTVMSNGCVSCITDFLVDYAERRGLKHLRDTARKH